MEVSRGKGILPKAQSDMGMYERYEGVPINRRRAESINDFSAPPKSPKNEKIVGRPLRHSKSESDPCVALLDSDRKDRLGERISSWAVWDKELALQGKQGKSDWGPELSPTYVCNDTEDKDFASRIRVRSYVKFFDKSILNYDTEGIMGLGVIPAALTTASVLANSAVICNILVIVAVMLVVLVSITFWDIHFAADSAANLTFLVNGLHTLCVFLLGFFISTCLSRWWAIRNNCIGALWGCVDDLSMIIGSYFPNDNDADQEVRDRVIRWGALSHELIYKQALASADLSDLVDSGLLTSEECETLERLVSKPQVVWAWMTSYFTFLAQGDPDCGGSRLPYAVTVLPQLHTICRTARGAVGSAFAYTDTQVPFRYVHLLCLIVWAQGLFQAANSAVVISRALGAHDAAHVAIELVFLILYPTLYFALLRVGAGMLNPLRASSKTDFPRGAYTYYMLAENRSLSAGAARKWSGRQSVNHLPRSEAGGLG